MRQAFCTGGPLHGKTLDLPFGYGEYLCAPTPFIRFSAAPSWVYHYPSAYYRYVGYIRKAQVALALYCGIRYQGWNHQKELTP